jgi:hypothetical protein
MGKFPGMIVSTHAAAPYAEPTGRKSTDEKDEIEWMFTPHSELTQEEISRKEEELIREREAATGEMFDLLFNLLDEGRLVDFRMIQLLSDNGANLAIADLEQVKEALLESGFSPEEVGRTIQQYILVSQATVVKDLNQEMLWEMLGRVCPMKKLEMLLTFPPRMIRTILLGLPPEMLMEILRYIIIENNENSQIRIFTVQTAANSQHGLHLLCRLVWDAIYGRDIGAMQAIMASTHGRIAMAETVLDIIRREDHDAVRTIRESPCANEIMKLALMHIIHVKGFSENVQEIQEITESLCGSEIVLLGLHTRDDPYVKQAIESPHGTKMLSMLFGGIIKKGRLDMVQDMARFCNLSILTQTLCDAIIREDPEAVQIIMELRGPGVATGRNQQGNRPIDLIKQSENEAIKAIFLRFGFE